MLGVKLPRFTGLMLRHASPWLGTPPARIPPRTRGPRRPSCRAESTVAPCAAGQGLFWNFQLPTPPPLLLTVEAIMPHWPITQFWMSVMARTSEHHRRIRELVCALNTCLPSDQKPQACLRGGDIPSGASQPGPGCLQHLLPSPTLSGCRGQRRTGGVAPVTP